jgi:SAM-dependent methyltransferase
MLASARERARRLEVGDRFELRHASAEDLSAFAPGTFHLALCMELFDHLPDLGRVLAEVHRVLQPAGQLVFTYVPSESLYGSLGNVYRWIRRRAAAAVPMISRTYSFGEIGRTLGEHGFQLERYWGVGLLCASAQTRLFQENLLIRALTAIARAEAERLPYYETPVLARRGAHVVGLARALPR